MARVTGKNGACVLYSSTFADYNSWSLRFNHPVEDDTNYGTTGSGASHSGSLTLDYTFSATGFLKSNASSTAPGWGGSSAVVAAASGSLTLTAHTGCTEAFTGILTGGAINHAKRSGAIPVSYEGIASGDLTETWATS